MYQSLISQIQDMLKSPYKSRNKLFLRQFGEQGVAYAHLTPDVLFKLSMACVFAKNLKDVSFMEDVYRLNEDLMEHAENDVQSKAQYVRKFNKHMKKKGLVKDERIEKLEKIASFMNTTDPTMVQSHRELETMALDYFDSLSLEMCQSVYYKYLADLFEQIVTESSLDSNLDSDSNLSQVYEEMQNNLREVIVDTLPYLMHVYPKTYEKAKNNVLNDTVEVDVYSHDEDYWCVEYGNILEKNEYSKAVKDELDEEQWLELYTYQLESLIQSMLSSFKYVLRQSCYTHELNKLVQKINELGL